MSKQTLHLNKFKGRLNACELSKAASHADVTIFFSESTRFLSLHCRPFPFSLFKNKTDFKKCVRVFIEHGKSLCANGMIYSF